jgi:hypothetical protein
MGNAPLGHEICGHVLTTPEEQTLVRDLHLTPDETPRPIAGALPTREWTVFEWAVGMQHVDRQRLVTSQVASKR